MTNINDLLRAVCVELSSRFGFLKNSAEQRMTDSPHSGIICVDQDVNTPAQERSQEILRKKMTVKQTNPPTQKQGHVLTEASPYSTPEDVTRTHLRKLRTSLSSSSTDFTFQKSLARSR